MKHNLDNFQEEIVKCQTDLLVIAGPGSGKTTTILEKVKYLQKICNDEEILLISFTNKSVNDIKTRLNANIDVVTFHKLAIDILKYNNIKFNICSENTLSYIIDEYFLCLNDKKRLCKYLNINSLNLKSKEYLSLKKLIITFINLFKTNNHNIETLSNIVDKYDDKYILMHVFNIFKEYEIEKQSTNSLDFDDIIIQATLLLKNRYNYKKYKYIIIDEFQDTSLIRLNLIKEIYTNCNSTITCVGDDAQSIYHFSGCDLSILLNFKNFFPKSEIKYLNNTYRYSNDLLKISENFINKNPYQLKKNMHSFKNSNNSLEIIYYISPILKFKSLLNKYKDKEILILGRNKNDIYSYIDNDFILQDSVLTYNNKKISYLTIHSAKGLEAEIVIIINCSDSLLGIPNKIENHRILSYLTKEDNYLYSEERRVFFVAITRCKEKTILLTPRTNPSPFVKEIEKYIQI